jgi:hypothetical protein
VGHGNAAPKPIVFPEAQGAELPEGNNDPCANRARRGTSPAGCSTMARTKRTAQTPGRPSPLLDISRSGGEPATVSDARHVAGARVVGLKRHRTSARIEVGHRQGAPEPWSKGAGSRRAA